MIRRPPCINAGFTAPWSVLSQLDSHICGSYLPHAERVVSCRLVAEGCCMASLASWRAGTQN